MMMPDRLVKLVSHSLITGAAFGCVTGGNGTDAGATCAGKIFQVLKRLTVRSHVDR